MFIHVVLLLTPHTHTHTPPFETSARHAPTNFVTAFRGRGRIRGALRGKLRLKRETARGDRAEIVLMDFRAKVVRIANGGTDHRRRTGKSPSAGKKKIQRSATLVTVVAAHETRIKSEPKNFSNLTRVRDTGAGEPARSLRGRRSYDLMM